MTHSPRLLLLFALWGVVSLVVAASGVLARLPTPAFPLIVVVSTVALTLGLTRNAKLREAVGQFGVKSLLVPHLFRFVGIYFLWLHAQGRLPVEFAHRAGWGDIVAATGALILLFVPVGTIFRRAALAWSVVGFADLLVAVGTAVWLNRTRPGSMAELQQLPLGLLPIFLVPSLLSLHLVIARRLRRADLP